MPPRSLLARVNVGFLITLKHTLKPSRDLFVQTGRKAGSLLSGAVPCS